MLEKNVLKPTNIESLSYLGFGKDLVKKILDTTDVTSENKKYLEEILEYSNEDIDDKINTTISAYKLKFKYEPSKENFWFINKDDQKVNLSSFSKYLLNSIKIQKIEEMIKNEEVNIQSQIRLQIHSDNTNMIYLDMEQAERLLNINIIENDEESFDVLFSNENFMEIYEAKKQLENNLKNRFGVNVSNITVVNNQFIIEDKKHTIEGNLNLNRLNTLNQKIKSISKNRLN